jgi:excisionase family DNA binding protein
VSLSIAIPGELVELVAARVLEVLEERGALAPDPWLSVAEAADYARCSKQRIYDLVAANKLAPGRDGRRLVFRRSELDRYLEGRAA